MATIQRIVPCLWFNNEAEDAAKYYVSIFERSKILRVTHYGKEGFEVHKRPAGSVLTVEFELDGCHITALNGGPLFKFTEAISLQVMCDSQGEIDRYWDKLRMGGDERAQQCGWLKDKYGLSWQVAPAEMSQWIGDPDPVKAGRVMTVMLKMKKMDLAALKKAHHG